MKTKAEYHAEKFRKKHKIEKNGIMWLYEFPFKVYTDWTQRMETIWHDEELLDHFLDDDDINLNDFVWVSYEKTGILNTKCSTSFFTFPSIYMAKSTFTFPMRIVESIFYHELGHCVLHALDNVLRPVFTQFVDVDAYKKLAAYDLLILLVKDELNSKKSINLEGLLMDNDLKSWFTIYLSAYKKQMRILKAYIEEFISDGIPLPRFRGKVLNIIEEYCDKENLQQIYYSSENTVTSIVEIEADLFASVNTSFNIVKEYYDMVFSLYSKRCLLPNAHSYIRYIMHLFTVTVKVYNDPRIQELLPYYKLMDPKEWKVTNVKK